MKNGGPSVQTNKENDCPLCIFFYLMERAQRCEVCSSERQITLSSRRPASLFTKFTPAANDIFNGYRFIHRRFSSIFTSRSNGFLRVSRPVFGPMLQICEP